jgi:hypothetical protein
MVAVSSLERFIFIYKMHDIKIQNFAIQMRSAAVIRRQLYMQITLPCNAIL